MIARLIPYPALSTALFIVWVMLAQSTSPGQLLLAVIAAVLAGKIMTSMRWRPTRISSWRTVMKLARLVFIDILRSNLAVASIVVSKRRTRTSSFILMGLEMRNEVGLTLLALIITATPGTAWVQFDRASGSLLIHVFDLVDEEQWVDLLKSRYEALLMEIFEL